jgi:hypothetical protein
MKTGSDNKRQKERISDLRTTDGEELEHESRQLRDGLRIFRDSLRATAERPDAFWTRQRAAISAGLRRRAPASKLRQALLWAPTSIVVLVCLFLFVGKTKLPAPDFAVGADQNLLVDVEQALYRDCPEALAPAAILAQEIR